MRTVDRRTYEDFVVRLDWDRYKDLFHRLDDSGRKSITTIRLSDQVIVAVEEYGGDRPDHFEIFEILEDVR